MAKDKQMQLDTIANYTKCLQSLLPVLVCGIMLQGCGGSPPAADKELENEDGRRVSVAASKEILPVKSPSDSETNEPPGFSSEVEEKIDQYLAQHEVETLQELFDSAAKSGALSNFEMTGPQEQRLHEGMMLLVASQHPEALQVLQERSDKEGSGESAGMLGFHLGFETENANPDVIRQLVGHLVMEDSEAFFEVFLNELDQSSVMSAMDPDAASPFRMDVIRMEESIDSKE